MPCTTRPAARVLRAALSLAALGICATQVGAAGTPHWTRYSSGCVLTMAPEVTENDPSCVPSAKQLKEMEERSKRRALEDTPKIGDFIGTWSQVDDKCRSLKSRTEGPYFTISNNNYTPEGGGSCKNVKFSLSGNKLSISAKCLVEEAGYQQLHIAYLLQANKLYDENRNLYDKCK